MLQRGQIQLRGLIQWKSRRALTRIRVGRKMNALPIVFGNAIPKNGSTLLFNILRGLPQIGPFVDTGLNEIKPNFRGRPTDQRWILRQLRQLKPGDVRLGYLYATPRNMAMLSRDNWAVFFIMRDPRDAIVSAIYYNMEISKVSRSRDYFRSLPNMEARIQAEIEGIRGHGLRLPDVRARYERFLPWIGMENVHTIRFEDLISQPDGELIKIIRHLEGYGYDPAIAYDKAINILKKQMAPEKSDTFRRGKPGEWKAHFTEANKQQFKKVAGDLLIRMGYERNHDW